MLFTEALFGVDKRFTPGNTSAGVGGGAFGNSSQELASVKAATNLHSRANRLNPDQKQEVFRLVANAENSLKVSILTPEFIGMGLGLGLGGLENNTVGGMVLGFVLALNLFFFRRYVFDAISVDDNLSKAREVLA